MIVAIDGPAASGKSTTARLVARAMGWLYMDTGAMYRAVTLKVLRERVPLGDPRAIGALAEKTSVELVPASDGVRVVLDGEDVTAAIRTPAVDGAIGPVCEVSKVRTLLVDQQRRLAQAGNAVAEGRDVGTVVFPRADFKFFMTASLDARAARRQKDLEQQGIAVSLKSLKADIERRDRRDSARIQSPLVPADDAVHVDTSGMTVDEQVRTVLDRIRQGRHRSVESRRVNRLYAALHVIMPPLFKVFLGLRIRGREWFPAEGGLIVAANHVSNFDPVVMGTASPRELHFLAKVELFRIPVFSGILRKLNAIPLRRKAADRGALVAAMDVLNRRNVLLLFPEGTRSRTGEIQEGKRGIGMLAVKNGVNVLPVHISGTFHLLRSLWHRRVIVRFGRPIAVEPFLKLRISSKELYRKIGEETMKRIKELRDAHHD